MASTATKEEELFSIPGADRAQAPDVIVAVGFAYCREVLTEAE